MGIPWRSCSNADYDSGGLQQGLRLCISSKLPTDINAAGLWATQAFWFSKLAGWLRDGAGKGTPGGHKTIDMVKNVSSFPISRSQPVYSHSVRSVTISSTRRLRINPVSRPLLSTFGTGNDFPILSQLSMAFPYFLVDFYRENKQTVVRKGAGLHG